MLLVKTAEYSDPMLEREMQGTHDAGAGCRASPMLELDAGHARCWSGMQCTPDAGAGCRARPMLERDAGHARC